MTDLGERIISYVCFEVLRGMSPESIIRNYLPHIENYMAEERIEIRFHEARATKRVRLVCKGLLNAYFKKNPKKGRVKVVFSLPMTDAVPVFLRHEPVWLQQLIRLAMRVGIWFLLRKGEYLKTSRNNGGIRRRELEFTASSGARIQYTHVGTSVVAQALNVNVTFSKTDPHGYGRLVSHQRQPPGSPCIVSEMERFIAMTRDLWGAGEDMAVFL